MTDPLSVTLAVVTLATALKDIVELAQMIEESCEKVSRNRRELHVLASEIKTTVSLLKKFGDDHHDVLRDAEDMKASLLGLITNMRAIYDKCCEMFPPIPPKRLEKFKVAFTVWKNRNRIEEDIKDLRDRVNKCHSQFMMFTVMRIESHLVVIKRQHRVDHRQSRQEIATVGASDDHIIAFVGPNSTRASSKLPPGITADFIADTYICLQIDVIDGMLNQLSSNFYPVEETLEEFLLPFKLSTRLDSLYDKYTIRQELVRRLLEIQSYLRSDSEDLSIQAGALAMLTVGGRLEALKMYNEIHTTEKWAVNIFRASADTNPEIYHPYLIASLRNHSITYEEVDDIDSSFSAITEAVEISRSLQSSTTNIEIEFQLAEALASLSSTLCLMNNIEESLKTAQESVDIYENAFRRCYDLPNQPFNSMSASFFEDIPPKFIFDYVYALDRRSYSLEGLGRLEDAFYTGKKALDIMTFFTKSFINDWLEIQIADLLLRLSWENFHEFMALEEALSFSERAVALYRAHCSKDVEEHGFSLCMALCQQADILEKMKRHDEALAVCRQTFDLANDIIADQRTRFRPLQELSRIFRQLKHYDEAVLIRAQYVTVYSECTKNKADCYYDLGVELQWAGRWPEASKALQAALTQYRALAFKDPETYSQNIGATLNELMKSLIHSKEFDQAFNEGYESLKLHQSLLENDASVLKNYIFAVKQNRDLAEVADNEDKCVERALYNITCAHNIARKHPSEGRLLPSEMIRRSAMVLYRFHRVSEAESIIQEALEWHEQNLSQDEEDVEEYMRCLICADVIVHRQGYWKKGAQYLQKSIDIGKLHSSHKTISSALVQSMSRRVDSLYLSGLYSEAVEAGKEYIAFGRENTEEDIDDLIQCLHITAMALQYHEKHDEAIVYIQEALELSRSAGVMELSYTYPYFLLLEPGSLTYLSRILADAGQEAQAIVEAKAAVEKALGLKSKYAFLSWSDIESTYIDALETYSLRLAAGGDLSGALDRLAQVRAYYEVSIEFWVCSSLLLGPILYTEGIICCAAGRHDDGAAAVAKLHDLQSRLRIVHPELSENVEVALKRRRTLPSMVTLIKKLDLKCDHEH